MVGWKIKYELIQNECLLTELLTKHLTEETYLPISELLKERGKGKFFFH